MTRAASALGKAVRSARPVTEASIGERRFSNKFSLIGAAERFEHLDDDGAARSKKGLRTRAVTL